MLTTLTAAVVSLIYYFFEYAVRYSIDFLWDDLFDTNSLRWLVVPLCVGLTLAYFGVRHWLDPKSEHKIGHSLGDIPDATLANLAKILGIGFLSLVAGASLGPEAVLVPACFVAGAYIGKRLAQSDESAGKLLGVIGFVSLFAAFFSSVVFGLLGLLLLKRQFKATIQPVQVALAIYASVLTVLILKKLEAPTYFRLPDYSWAFDFSTMIALIALILAGYIATYSIKSSFGFSRAFNAYFYSKPWWVGGLIAGCGLSVIYLLGGSLVQFTGNEAIVPMYHQAGSLGLAGLLWVFLMKVIAIGWSHASGYRGGLVFPSIFIAAILAVIAQYYMPELNLVYGLLAALTGMLVADSRAKILT